MRKFTMAATAAFLTLSASAYAQSTVIIEQPSEPVVTHSTTHVLPGEVRTYVMQQQPVESIPYDGDVLVGRVLPESVEVRPVEGYSNYGYTIVNERRVIVDPQTHTVIQVLD
ncbi:DUF1236 domain-containing protein [Neorhizobium sp. NPDC001467]|uniref:DUF1236 domain-containing protein n=1 Tax=Neorhizobium sp. NPDC001467 TaxID=3390595 RepID=UPI003D024674